MSFLKKLKVKWKVLGKSFQKGLILLRRSFLPSEELYYSENWEEVEEKEAIRVALLGTRIIFFILIIVLLLGTISALITLRNIAETTFEETLAGELEYIKPKAIEEFQHFYLKISILFFFTYLAINIMGLSFGIIAIKFYYKGSAFLDCHYLDRRLFKSKFEKKYLRNISLKIYSILKKRILLIFIVGLAIITPIAYLFESNGLFAIMILFLIIVEFLVYSITVMTIAKKEKLPLYYLRKLINSYFISVFYGVSYLFVFVYFFVPIMYYLSRTLTSKILFFFFCRWRTELFNDLEAIKNILLEGRFSTLLDPSWNPFSGDETFWGLVSYLPLAFVAFLIVILFSYILPAFYLSKIERRRITAMLISFIFGYIISRVIFLSFPKIFFLRQDSLYFAIILAMIAYFTGEFFETQIRDVTEVKKECRYCGGKNVTEAEYCMFCGRKLPSMKA